MLDKVGILGGGSFGITCSILSARNTDVLLYCRNKEQVKEVNSNHTLKGKSLPKNVVATSDLKLIGDECQLIVPVIPSKHFRSVIKEISPYLNPKHFVIHATKGLECSKLSLETPSSEISRSDIKTMSEVIVEETNVIRVGCLAGPNLAKEIIAGQPAATVIASDFEEVIELGRSAFESSVFKVFGSSNLLGIELAGAFKNVIAIASGIMGGLNLGKNVQAVSITRGWMEVIRTCIFLGANKEAFLGVAGLGDLIATATSEDSRNYTFGMKLAEGKSLNNILDEMDEVSEGVYTTKILYSLVKNNNIHAPICQIIYKILYEDFPIEKAIPSLMKYPFSQDVDF